MKLLKLSLDTTPDVFTCLLLPEMTRQQNNDLVVFHALENSFNFLNTQTEGFKKIILSTTLLEYNYLKPYSLKFLTEKGIEIYYAQMTVEAEPNITGIEISCPAYIIHHDFGSLFSCYKYRIKPLRRKKTNKFEIEIKHLEIPCNLFMPAYSASISQCSSTCAEMHLFPKKEHDALTWWETFQCRICEKEYVCDCFKESIVLHMHYLKDRTFHNKNDYLRRTYVDNIQRAEQLKYLQFRSGICYLCNPDSKPKKQKKFPYGLFYPYINNMAVSLGNPHIYDPYNEYEYRDINREAENRIRGFFGYHKIGERWVHETSLFPLASQNN